MLHYLVQLLWTEAPLILAKFTKSPKVYSTLKPKLTEFLAVPILP